MRTNETRPKNPYNKPAEDPHTYSRWGARSGEELGYQKTYGEYASNNRGWVDRSHGRLQRRREASVETYPDYSGLGPRTYRRADESILDHVAQLLTWSPDVDASEITIAVKDGHVILAGSVPDPAMMPFVDELMDKVHGLRGYDNRIAIARA